MKAKKKILIVAGGTGGHVLPAYNLYKHLKKNYFVKIITDKRGLNFLNKKKVNFVNFSSSTVYQNNPFKLILSLVIIFSAFLRSILYFKLNRVDLVVGMGGYTTFPVCIAAKFFNIPFLVYENNLFVGKANKYLIPFSKKIMVSYNSVKGIKEKYKFKTITTGNILDKELFKNQRNLNFNIKKKISILVIGGSQAARSFGEKLPSIFLSLKKEKIKIKVYQQCTPEQNLKLNNFYKRNKINFELFNFTLNIKKYLKKTDICITRSGSSMTAELINYRIPFIAVPLPNSADNHQYLNAKYLKRLGVCFFIEEKSIEKKMFKQIYKINKNSLIIKKMKQRQSKFSDKNVYKIIDREIKKIL